MLTKALVASAVQVPVLLGTFSWKLDIHIIMGERRIKLEILSC